MRFPSKIGISILMASMKGMRSSDLKRQQSNMYRVSAKCNNCMTSCSCCLGPAEAQTDPTVPCINPVIVVRRGSVLVPFSGRLFPLKSGNRLRNRSAIVIYQAIASFIVHLDYYDGNKIYCLF